MLIYTKGTHSDTVVTLNEFKTLTAPYYLFVFTHVTLKTTVTKIVAAAADASSYPDRVNIFTFDSVALFASAAEGQYFYRVYEQASAVNTDPTGLTQVECGKMILKTSSPLIKQGYEPTTTYKGYAG
jgi:hypothetical protein